MRDSDAAGKKPVTHRDGVLMLASAAGSAALLWAADRAGELAIALKIWGYMLGGISVAIIFALIWDRVKSVKKR